MVVITATVIIIKLSVGTFLGAQEQTGDHLELF